MNHEGYMWTKERGMGKEEETRAECARECVVSKDLLESMLKIDSMVIHENKSEV